MTTFEGVLAAAIIIAALVQVVVLILLFRAVSQLAQRIERLIDVVEPELHELAEGARALRGAAEATAGEVHASLAAVRAALSELSTMAREQGAEIRETIQKATAIAQRQMDETEIAIDRVRQRITEFSGGVDRAVLEPARAALAVATGVRRGLSFLLNPRARRRNDSGDSGDWDGQPEGSAS